MNFRAEGDRVPTRERGYRSANQNMRRRDLHKKNIQNLQSRGAANTMSSVNETVAEHPTEHEHMIPQGLWIRFNQKLDYPYLMIEHMDKTTG